MKTGTKQISACLCGLYLCPIVLFSQIHIDVPTPGAVIHAAEQAAAPVVQAAQQVAAPVVHAAEQVAAPVVHAAEQVVAPVAHAADQVTAPVIEQIKKTPAEASKFAKDSVAAAIKAIDDTNKTLAKAADDTNKNLGKAADDTLKTLDKAGKDIAQNADKGTKDYVKNLDKAGKDLVDAGKAVVRFHERQLKSTQNNISAGERRFREGKVIDALWHLETGEFTEAEQNAAKAAQESEVLNVVGQAAATAYGGPAGAAAYAAWYTYNQTGDINLALKAGIISGASSVAFSAVGNMPSSTISEETKKVILAGAIGGLAVAAAGGDEAAMREGFLKSGAMVLVQDGYKNVTKNKIDAKASKGAAYYISGEPGDDSFPEESYMRDSSGKVLKNPDGTPKIDMTKVDPSRPHVGMQVVKGQPTTWAHENSPFMTSVSRIPGMNAMALFHDQWAMSWDMSGVMTKATIPPAIVLTYIGTGAPVYNYVQETVVTSDQKKKTGT